MKLFDDVRESSMQLITNLNGKCPFCGSAFEIKDARSKRFVEYECVKCHLRLEISTRNNQRMIVAGMFLLVAFAFGLLLAL